MIDESANQSTPQDEAGKLPVSRRWLLLKIGMAFNGLVGLAVATPVIGYLLSPVKKDKDYLAWVSLGPVTDFPVGQTRLTTFTNPFRQPWDGVTDGVACYVRRTAEQSFKVFAVNCAHLGCPVRWFPQSELFMCPCHGGVYYADGERASGPPERGLFEYPCKVVNGRLEIDAGQMPTLANTARLVDINNAKGSGACAG